ncbi:MAG TPA: hypothetical protein ENJ82_01415 [Bacteroidetes bacterium]|nr:hypothetical protein [Bacteroidota bacterium]
MNKAIILTMILLVFFGITWLGIQLFSFSPSSFGNKLSLHENFKAKSSQIISLKNYFEKLIPENVNVSFEFSSENNKFDLGILLINPATKMEVYPAIGGEKISPGSAQMDSLLDYLNWNMVNIDTLVSKLQQSNCVGVSGGNPIQILFRKSGLESTSYLIFDQPLSDSLQKLYNHKEGYSVYNETTVLREIYPL